MCCFYSSQLFLFIKIITLVIFLYFLSAVLTFIQFLTLPYLGVIIFKCSFNPGWLQGVVLTPQEGNFYLLLKYFFVCTEILKCEQNSFAPFLEKLESAVAP